MGKNRKRRPIYGSFIGTALALLPLLAFQGLLPFLQAQTTSNSAKGPPQEVASSNSPNLSRGQKLMLKDGSFQIVREYHVEGDRVRYYSLDRSQWEEIPAALVDWDQTKKVAAEKAASEAAAISKVKAEEAERNPQLLDIDASVEVAPGIFLPQGDGIFAFDGKTVLKLAEARIKSTLSKKNAIEQVLVPVPVVPTRHNIFIERPHAEYRVTNGQPEFYMRVTNGLEPNLELIRAKVHGDAREIEHLDQLYGQERFVKDALPMQVWLVAPGLYRFTLGSPLLPGEYALAEATDAPSNGLYVWDFGVDASSKVPASKQHK